jgi:tetratricopeptide (TPR) repeat protein
MKRYIARRLMQGAVLLCMVATIVFFLGRLTGNPVDLMLPEDATAEDRAALTKTLGRHTLKTGFLYRLEHAGRTVNNPTGLGFNGGLVQDPNTNQGGPGLAQLMLGAVDNYSWTGLTASPYQRSRYWGFYLQDDFRITPKFTLNLGLRYDINGFFKTREGPMSNFCLTCPNPTTGLKGKMIYWGDPEFPDGHDMAPANKNSLGPRVNFSWAPFADRKTIIRGGYDLFYTNAGNSYNNVGMVLNEQGKCPQAQPLLEKALELDPKDGGVAGGCADAGVWALGSFAQVRRSARSVASREQEARQHPVIRRAQDLFGASLKEIKT